MKLIAVNLIIVLIVVKNLLKKGELRRHHFAHKPKSVCKDSWERDDYYDKTDWHYKWQDCFPRDNQEVLVSNGDIKHRADVMVDKTVAEFQHSAISEANYNNRNNFYSNLGYKVVWLFDVRDDVENEKIDLNYADPDQVVMQCVNSNLC